MAALAINKISPDKISLGNFIMDGPGWQNMNPHWSTSTLLKVGQDLQMGDMEVHIIKKKYYCTERKPECGQSSRSDPVVENTRDSIDVGKGHKDAIY